MTDFATHPRVPGIWGHRGASRAKPENTVEAFLEAARLGADGVELDVRRTRDGALAVHHDAALGDGRLIVETDAGDLPPAVPFLGQALDACAGMLVNIEIKNVQIDPDYDPDETVAAGVAALVRERSLHDRVIVSSFSLAAIDRIADLDADIRRGWLVWSGADQRKAVDLAAEHGHHAVHPYHEVVDDALVDAAHAAGLAVNTWTVDDPDRIRWLVGLGVDAVITNVPDVAIAALRAPT
ncbi:MAG TPA: glycerophosphodiester phosphodiesterase [Acidimicrobiales bacterium]|nr:glycerophosphodiester phosphodiesterase [Acidimicrobiales bacterium]